MRRSPGKKVFIRGNHDYWWNGITKLRDRAPDGTFYFLQNDSVRFDGVVICGSRGWTCPGSPDYTEKDNKIYLREAERFKLCFRDAAKLRSEGDKLIAMIHYPPYSLKNGETLFTQLFEENGVDFAVFGHIHGEAYFPFRSNKNGWSMCSLRATKSGSDCKKLCKRRLVFNQWRPAINLCVRARPRPAAAPACLPRIKLPAPASRLRQK